MKWILIFINLIIVALYLFSSNSLAQTLKPYECLEHFSIESYINQDSRSIDSKGIITQKKQYHALTVSFYGIMSYENFIKTGDSIYFRQAIDQFNYFRDSSKLIYTNGDSCIGLPYRYDYKGLKAPWFSGMTQGAATSYLLRYYNLTKDESALILSEKIIRFMLKTESEGGTIGRTKEGGPWIEEYPSYPKSKSVLNGFINGLIGLKEYCDYFPNDIYAKEMHDSCYREMIEHIHLYDSPNWTAYNRNNHPVRNSYMRYQLEEFDHLYNIYHDERLRRQMKIWSRFAAGKYDTELKFLIHPLYDFSQEILYEVNAKNFTFDCSEQFFEGLREIPTEAKSGKIKLMIPQKSNYFQIGFQKGKTIRKFRVKAYNCFRDIKLKISETDSSIVFESKEPFDEIMVRVKRKEVKNLRFAVYDYKQCALPQFAWFNLSGPVYITKGQKISVDGEMINLTNGVVFYRVGRNEKDTKNYAFRQNNFFPIEGGMVANDTGFYEFFVSYDLTHPFSSVRDFNIRVSD